MATESTLKMMKSAFYFTLKAFFLNLNVFLEFLVMLENGLITKTRFAINILSNISKSKDNHAIKFDQLIELKNHTQKVVEKLLPDPFLKNQN